MGAFCTPSYDALPSTSETVAGTEIPEWVAAAGRTAFARAAELSDEPYPLYADEAGMLIPRIAELTDLERTAYKGLEDGAEDYLPFFNDASTVADTLGKGYGAMTEEELLGDEYIGATREELLGDNYVGATREQLIGDSADPFSLASAQPYLDIYQSAMDPAIREIQEQSILAQNAARARASTGGGAFGSRLGIMEGTTSAKAAEAAGDLRAGAARDALGFAAGRYDADLSQAERDRAARFSADSALRSQYDAERQARFGADAALRSQYDTDRQARFGADTQARQGYETDEASRIQQMEAYQGMAPLIQDLQRQAAAGLIGAGEAERMLDQQALDIAYADFLDEKLYPQEQLNFALGALAGTPYNTINRSYTSGTQMSANPSLFGQTLAGMGGLYSAYKMANS